MYYWKKFDDGTERKFSGELLLSEKVSLPNDLLIGLRAALIEIGNSIKDYNCFKVLVLLDELTTRFSMLYLSFVRTTPPILLITFFYSLLSNLLNFLLKSSGFDIFAITLIYYAFIIFSFMTTGNLSEIIRSAILTVDRGHLEAAEAIGMTEVQAYLRLSCRFALPNFVTL